MTEQILLSATRISTFAGAASLTGATGFFFTRASRLYLITSRHVFLDPESQHAPDRIEILVHLDRTNLTRIQPVDIALYAGGVASWKEARDSGGPVDVAAIEVPSDAIPHAAVLHAFNSDDLIEDLNDVEAGASILMVAYPLGFYDTVHHLPIVRQAIIASAFGIRFQGKGYFLTDARMHRGASGAPDLAPALPDTFYSQCCACS